MADLHPTETNGTGLSAAPHARSPRLLWANLGCLLDTANGAAMAAREMLLQLVGQGYAVRILGATLFDHPRGTLRLQDQWESIIAQKGRLLAVVDGPLEHRLLVTASTRRREMTSAEESIWFAAFQEELDQFKPDLVFYYGGQPLDLLIPCEARARGIPSVFYLVNGNYQRSRWCRDVDLILTDSQATADRYGRQPGLRVTPVGAFVAPSRVVAREQTRQHLLFINPTLEKGAAVVIRLALLMERLRPDIIFEVVESRGQWGSMLRRVTGSLGEERESLANVVVTPNTDDMRPIYGRARLLLAPSLWWESGARVVVEAMLNGIPALITGHGGMAELAQGGGIRIDLPAAFHQPPYTRVPTEEQLKPVVERLITLHDDAAGYEALAALALQVGQRLHSLEHSTRRLVAALQPWVEQRAGDRETDLLLRQVHKHGLDDRRLPEDENDSRKDAKTRSR